MAIYFLAEINNLSRYERVPPLVWHCVSIYLGVEGVVVAMDVGGVEPDLGGRTMAARVIS